MLILENRTGRSGPAKESRLTRSCPPPATCFGLLPLAVAPRPSSRSNMESLIDYLCAQIRRGKTPRRPVPRAQKASFLRGRCSDAAARTPKYRVVANLPEHPHTHRPPCRPHVAGAHVSGPCWRLPGCEETFFGAIYVRDGVVSTVPCTSSVAAVCRRELLSAVVFSRVAGAWPMVARLCYSSVYF